MSVRTETSQLFMLPLKDGGDAIESAATAAATEAKAEEIPSPPEGADAENSEKKGKKRRKVYMPLGMRFVIMLVAFGTVLSTISTTISYYTYRRANIAKYQHSADNTARQAADLIDADKIDGYLESAEPDADYWRILQGLRQLADSTRAAYIIVVRAYPDGKWRWIYDTDPKPYPVSYEMDALAAYGKKAISLMNRNMVAGRYYGPHVIPPHEGAPELLMVAMPLTNAAGDVKAHICVGFSMEAVAREQRTYLMRLVLIQFLITAFFCGAYLLALRKTVVIPVKMLAKYADEFLHRTESGGDTGKTLNIFGNLKIDSDDELKVLQIALQQMEAKINTHIEDLNVANRRASTDSLTGLRNREYFHRRISDFLWTQFSKPPAERLGCAFIMIDVDYFKLVNDHYGHAEGDQMLIKFAGAIKATFRADDVMARMGGDEFGVFCEGIPGTAIIRTKAEILQKKLEKILIGNSSKAITASIGIYVSLGEISDYQSLYELADRAMYKVKEHGRNGFEILTATEVAAIDAAAQPS